MKMRWMKRSDLAEVSRIQEEDEASLGRLATLPRYVSKVAEIDGRVAGSIFYQLGRKKISIVRLAVDLRFRRTGVGSGLISSVVSKLSAERSLLEAVVCEYNLPAQLFLKSNGLRAVETVEDAGGCWYRFVLANTNLSG